MGVRCWGEGGGKVWGKVLGEVGVRCWGRCGGKVLGE